MYARNSIDNKERKPRKMQTRAQMTVKFMKNKKKYSVEFAGDGLNRSH